jgi:endoglucanase
MKKFLCIMLASALFFSACAGETVVSPETAVSPSETTTASPESDEMAETTAPERAANPLVPVIDLSKVSAEALEAVATVALVSKPQSEENPIEFDGINFGEGFRRGINFGNMLEAPSEGAWGVRALDEYFPIVKEMGFDFIRLPVRWNNYTTGTDHQIRKTFMDRVDHVVRQTLQQGLGLIINIHHFEGLDEEPEENEEKLYAIWRQLATHYADLPLNVIFEVNNEPHGNLTQDLWINYQKKCIEIIRETNPTRKILVTGADWGGPNTVPSLVLPKDDNLLISFHHYDPFQFTHQGASWSGNENRYLGTEWYPTEAAIRLIEQPFKKMRAWSEATGLPVVLGEFGAYDRADMESRVRWTKAMRELAEEYGFAWAYWEFCSGFGVYDPDKNEIREGLAEALLGDPIPENYGHKKGSPRFKVEETATTFGPATFDVKVYVIADSWTGYTLTYTEDETIILELGGKDAVAEWAQAFIPIPGVTDTGDGFSAKYVHLTIRNIDNSITDMGINIDNGGSVEAELMRPVAKDLHDGNGNDIIKNADGTVTLKLDLSRGYHTLKGKAENGVRLKLFIESMPAPHRANDYDQEGALEFLDLEVITG